MPSGRMSAAYSLAWGGQYPGEAFLPMVLEIASGKGVSELMAKVTANGNSGWRSISMNLVIADN